MSRYEEEMGNLVQLCVVRSAINRAMVLSPAPADGEGRSCRALLRGRSLLR
jgi:hypothetical protein